jgi:CheY-like chemotaxis protein
MAMTIQADEPSAKRHAYRGLADRVRPWPDAGHRIRPDGPAKRLPADRRAQAVLRKNNEGAKPVILVVDDEPMIRELLRLVLQGHGFRVLVAADGREALALYRAEHSTIALVLLDIRMPSLDGPETLTALRQFDPTVCACFLTADAGTYTTGELLACGAAQVLAKPFCAAELGSCLWQVIDQKQLQPCGDNSVGPRVGA